MPKWLIASVLVVLGSLLCIRLGFWQLDRLAQRRQFNAQYIAASQSEPLRLSGKNVEKSTITDYRRVVIDGSYDFNNNVVLRNQFRDGQPGYFLLTPLVLADGSGVLVERGWIPAEGNATPEDWHKYDQAGTLEITGILRTGQTQPEVGGVPDPPLTGQQSRLDYWNMVNLDRIANQLPYKLLPVFIQPNPEPVPDKPPYPYQPTIEISDGPHLGYALQWFVFASILFFGYPFFLRKQLVSSLKNTEPEEFE